MNQALSERMEWQARLPIVAAAWYDRLVADHPELVSMMSRQDYIKSFCDVYGRPIIITSGGTNSGEEKP